MMPGSAHHPASQPEPNVPGRRDFVEVYVQDRRPVPASAVLAITTERERRSRTTTTNPTTSPRTRPNAPPIEMNHFARCFAYAYITVIRDAIHAVLPGLEFSLTPPSHGADRTVHFASPDGREAAMEKEPFALTLPDGGAAASVVKLVREGETSNCFRGRQDWLAHVALLSYPIDKRSREEIECNCNQFGHLFEVDLSCYDAPDLSPVRVVLNMEHPREIPREVRIRYPSDFRFWHVVPVKILGVWDKSLSTNANGEYVPIYGAAAAAP